MDENKQPEAAAVDALDMDDFDAGFNDGIDEGIDAGQAAQSAVQDDGLFAGQPVPETGQGSSEPERPEYTVPVAPVAAPATAPSAPDTPGTPVAPAPGAPATASPIGVVEISEIIADEYAELERLSPQAAALAREDSPEGERLRARLERLGADSALDRAELILDRRERAAQAAHAQQQAVEAHNRHFQSVISAEHPDLFAPDRTPEQNHVFMSGVRTWIENKPYAEARGLMDIFENGRDPRQVAALISRFKQESGTGATGTTRTISATGGSRHTVDHTAALAVAGRGAPIVPKTVGGKDDFEAGWNL